MDSLWFCSLNFSFLPFMNTNMEKPRFYNQMIALPCYEPPQKEKGDGLKKSLFISLLRNYKPYEKNLLLIKGFLVWLFMILMILPIRVLPSQHLVLRPGPQRWMAAHQSGLMLIFMWFFLKNWVIERRRKLTIHQLKRFFGRLLLIHKVENTICRKFFYVY